MNRLFYIGVAIAAVVILAALFADVIATHDVVSQDLSIATLRSAPNIGSAPTRSAAMYSPGSSTALAYRFRSAFP